MTPPRSPASTATPAEPVAPPRRIRCANTADFIAAVPQLAGFTAGDSIFMVLFSGPLSSSAVRFDLPPDDTPTATTELLDLMCGILHETGATPGGPAILITSDQTFAEARGIPWRRLASRIRRRLAREGFSVRELCCRAPDGWGSYDDPDTPLTGRPLAELSASGVAIDAAERGVLTPHLDTVGALPKPSSAARDAVARELAKCTTAPPSADLCRAVTTLAHSTDPIEDLSAETCAQIIRGTNDDDGWLASVLALSPGGDSARVPAAQCGNMRPEHEIISALSAVPADRDAHRHVTDRMAQIAALAPVDERGGLLALLAWMWWRLGLNSVAARHLTAARQSGTAQAAVELLDLLFTNLTPPLRGFPSALPHMFESHANAQWQQREQ